MNWARGLFRLWLVLSIFWIAIWAVAMRPDKQWNQYSESYAKAAELAGELRELQRELNESTSSGYLTEAQVLAKRTAVKVKEERFMRADRDVEDIWSDIMAFLAIGPGFAVGVFVVGVSLFWAFRGFRGQSQ